MKDFINKKIIKEFMEENKLSKNKFCKLCGISVSTFNRIISNGNFRLSALFKIARVMDVQLYMLCV